MQLTAMVMSKFLDPHDVEEGLSVLVAMLDL